VQNVSVILFVLREISSEEFYMQVIFLNCSASNLTKSHIFMIGGEMKSYTEPIGKIKELSHKHVAQVRDSYIVKLITIENHV
jgi:hypothetical protein